MEDNGALSELLRQCGGTKSAIEKAIDEERGGEKVEDPNAEDQRKALTKYTVDLTALAEQGKLDPVIGRDAEIRRTIQVLQRRTKNNPLLPNNPMLHLRWKWYNAIRRSRSIKRARNRLI